MNSWIDFRELRSKLKFADVLRLYKVEVTPRGPQLVGFCPLPGHEGKKNSPSFSVNTERGIFQCFGCGAKGNVLDFAGLMEGINVRDGAALRRVAVKLQGQFAPEAANVPSAPLAKFAPPKAEPTGNLPVVVNEPLDFELKGLDPTHPYLLSKR